ncbi:GNAT family N-acetyltransferase [Conexibacter stalactiti]|uniref:GNAT family N-acetyltransferase n=1 Tax=Conexibacter stalactiti TaxID=1940611 RepID=A0ABU4HKX0_9ACTN|nr:GNAT family N-acetyltransferase [Conexibacter stalactiti]MDW5593354.1 GNAT family N-acetyltransferase [Conexibacter stalactiti]MEC5033995.1 GNAT family N-acetyltransferase [Conexibacter stalactiti]
MAVVFAPLRAADVDDAAEVTSAALPPPVGGTETPEGRLERQRGRFAGALASDPGGLWLAREGDVPVGVALALRSDGLWVLGLLAVAPAAQSGGIGRGLLERALAYGDDCRGALIASSDDPRALRLYATAGFALHPVVAADGPITRAALPAGLDATVAQADAAAVERTVPIDRAIRGGARSAHLATLLTVPDTHLFLAGERGYAVGRQGRLITLAATDELAAQALLWRVLAETPPGVEAVVERIGDGQQWALDVVVRAGLRLRLDGPLFTRGQLGPLRPFLPSGGYL